MRGGGYDAIVVGASVAGACTALLLGRAGHRVLLVERARFPRAKVCGEGLMPAGARILEQIGVPVSALGARSFPGIRFRLDRQPPLELDFSLLETGCRGLAVSREGLDSCLARHAARQANVTFRQGFRVAGCRLDGAGVQVRGESGETFAGRLLVGADGIRSRFHGRSGIRRLASSNGRFALRGLFEDFAHRDGWVDVFCSRLGEAYIAPLGPSSARVTLLLNQRLDGGPGDTERFASHLRHFPEVLARTGGRPPLRVDATAPVSRRVSACHGERLLLVGDAAGAVDPITGQGMTLALRDAQLAAEVAGDRLRRGRLKEADLRPYTARRRDYFERSDELSRRLLGLLERPWLFARVRRALLSNPRLQARLLASAVWPGSSGGLRWSDRLRLVAGL